MAEITLEPTALSKVIPISLKVNETDAKEVTRLATKKQFNTSDTDAWLSFTLQGLESTSGVYDLTMVNVDENPSSVVHHKNVAFSAIPFYYKMDSGADLLTNEIRHAGRWIGQIVVRLANGDTTSRQFDFAITGHLLDGNEARLILIEDYNSLIATITASKTELEGYNVDYAALLVDLAAAETARTATYNQLVADQQANIEAFDVALDDGIVAANLATKLQDFEATNNSRLLSAEQQLAEKSDKSEVANGMTAKGASLYASLPTTGNSIGDYYYCSNGNPVGNYVWNGSSWYFGGTGDEGYSKLKNSISLDSFKELKATLPWSVGDTKNDGSLGTYAYRISNTEILFFERDIVVECNADVRFGYCTYNSSGVKLAWNGWFTATTIIPKNTRFRLQISSSDADHENAIGAIADADNNVLYNGLHIYAMSELEERVSEIEDSMPVAGDFTLDCFKELKATLPWSKAYINNGVLFPYNYRISSTDILEFQNDIKITEIGDVKFSYASYDETDTYIGWSGWKTDELVVPKNTRFRFHIATTSANDRDIGVITDVYNNPLYNNISVVALSNDTSELSARISNIEQLNTANFSYNGLKVVKKIDDILWTQGAANVDGTILGFNASPDDHNGYSSACIYNDLPNSYSKSNYLSHNLGHAASADYYADTDTLLVANGTTTVGIVPAIYLVKGAKNKVANKTTLEYNGADTIELFFNGINGEGCIACFGETSDIVYVITTISANRYSLYKDRWVYKLFLGKGATDLRTLFPDTSHGSFISGCAENEYNGTCRVLSMYTGGWYGELQGMKYVSGKLLVSTDLYYKGQLTAYLITIECNDNTNTFNVEKSLWIPHISSDGSLAGSEAEGVVVVGNLGYVTLVQSGTEYKYRTFVFDMNCI